MPCKPLLAALLALLLHAAPALAAPTQYLLQRDASIVGFSWFFGQDEIKGTMPVASAEFLIDLANPERSRVTVSADVRGARAGFPFATQAMKGPKVLDAARHPLIRFVSRSIRGDLNGAVIEGDLTVRGVTRRVAFRATLYRQRVEAASDLSRLSVVVSGELSRSAFGATGWNDMAGDAVRLTFLARMVRAE